MTIRPFLVTVCGGLAYSEWHNILRTFSEAILTPCVKSVAYRGPIEAEEQVLQA
jgi:TPP-dependent trihydroxycyclohexane-1,2-dione (THcHDO) dehydratase